MKHSPRAGWSNAQTMAILVLLRLPPSVDSSPPFRRHLRCHDARHRHVTLFRDGAPSVKKASATLVMIRAADADDSVIFRLPPNRLSLFRHDIAKKESHAQGAARRPQEIDARRHAHYRHFACQPLRAGITISLHACLSGVDDSHHNVLSRQLTPSAGAAFQSPFIKRYGHFALNTPLNAPFTRPP